MEELYIGLMSGTSIDGIDAALIDFSNDGMQLVAFHYCPFPAELKQRIRHLSQPDQPILLRDYGHLDSELGQLFAACILALLDKAQIPASRIVAIGSHGQTVFHDPVHRYGFSLQIGDPNRIAQITGITTVADFRRRDIAVGGQGAPLVPAFHQAVFAEENVPKTIVNIGGIANITVLEGDNILGFDTGPGNTLMDVWCQQQRQQAFDRNGDWARSGQVAPDLLKELESDIYFRQPPPKSTGTEYFSPAWLERKLRKFPDLNPEDVQATLCQLTANSIATAIQQHAQTTRQILVCGGGVHNAYLIHLLQQKFEVPVLSTAAFGVDPDGVEAIAFAWLARQTLNGMPGNVSSVTGAKSPVVLGGIYVGNRGLGRK